MAKQILAYDALDRWLEAERLSRTKFAQLAGINERDFRRIMQTRSMTRKFSVEFAEKIWKATRGEIPRYLWIPVAR